jgi:hypothetical protein
MWECKARRAVVDSGSLPHASVRTGCTTNVATGLAPAARPSPFPDLRTVKIVVQEQTGCCCSSLFTTIFTTSLGSRDPRT